MGGRAIHEREKKETTKKGENLTPLIWCLLRKYTDRVREN